MVRIFLDLQYECQIRIGFRTEIGGLGRDCDNQTFADLLPQRPQRRTQHAGIDAGLNIDVDPVESKPTHQLPQTGCEILRRRGVTHGNRIALAPYRDQHFGAPGVQERDVALEISFVYPPRAAESVGSTSNVTGAWLYWIRAGEGHHDQVIACGTSRSFIEAD